SKERPLAISERDATGEIAVDRGLDDGVDLVLEDALALDPGRPALFLPRQLCLLFFLELGLVLGVFPEDLERGRHLSESVAAADAGHARRRIAGGELGHGVRGAADHAAEPAAEGDRQKDAQGDNGNAAGDRDPPGLSDRGGRSAAKLVAALALILDERLERAAEVAAALCGRGAFRR